ncbi:MAG: IclR family transcriptional regulator [Bacillota bacterium]
MEIEHNNSIRAVERALQVLSCFRPGCRELGVTEISQELGLYKSTVHRILQTLQNYGFVQQNPENQKYRLGLKLFELGSLVVSGLDIRRVALPYMKKLRDQLNETVGLNIINNFQRICVEKVESQAEVRNFVEVGQVGPLYCAASGKLLMAHLPPADQEYIITSQDLRSWSTGNSISPEELRQDLAQIRQQGYAISRNERVFGVCSISAPIKDHTGKTVAGLTVSGPEGRFTEQRVPEIIRLCISTASEISRELGFNPSRFI